MGLDITPLINGREYGWADLAVTIAGVPVMGITAIKYEEEQEKDNIYGAGRHQLSGPAYIDADSGFLRAETVSGLEALAAEPLDQMMRDAELSGYSVTIDPTQQVLRTSKLEVLVKLIPVGVLRNIEVKIGLTLKK
ncbi:DUF2586 family protein [Flavobacterium sp. TN-1]